jgi:hypothetical protein
MGECLPAYSHSGGGVNGEYELQITQHPTICNLYLLTRR